MPDEERFPLGMLDETLPWRHKLVRLRRYVIELVRPSGIAVINPPPPPARGGGEAGLREPRNPKPSPPSLSAVRQRPTDD